MRVALLAYTQLNPKDDSLPQQLRMMDRGAPEVLVEFAGRVCYRSVDRQGDGARFVAARVREGHESIIEHVSFTFLVDGISRSCSHQLVRHRIASYSQESQRYCEPEAEEGLVMPPAVQADSQARALWQQAVDGLTATYRALRERGVRKEDARFLLPNATATRIVVTMNARSLRHFFAVRLPRAAQWEIRSVALEMLRQVHSLAPALFGDLYELYADELDQSAQKRGSGQASGPAAPHPGT